MNLQAFFQQHPKAALGFSGGVDSSYLLYAGTQAAAQICPIFVKTAFQPQFELEDAKRVAAYCGTKLKIIELDILQSETICQNDPLRCYHCKHRIFEAVQAAGQALGYTLLLDGSNASDDAADRPGMKALRELGVASPLRDCGLKKAEIRRLAREAGLFTWDKPAYACLATRFPTGRTITADLLLQVEQAENALFRLGFTDFRLRLQSDCARIQLPEAQMENILRHRAEILSALAGFPAILLDLSPRQPSP